jgi:hypothetical protein
MTLLKMRSLQVDPIRVFTLSFFAIVLLLFGLWIYFNIPQPRSWQLHRGMTIQQVRSVMGEPDTAYGDQEHKYWCYSRKENINLRFINDRLDSADAEKGHPLNDP